MSYELASKHSVFKHQNSTKSQMRYELRIQERSFLFAARVVKLCQFFEKQDRLSRRLASQFLRSGTWIGANVLE